MFASALVIALLQQTPAEGVDWDKEYGVEERVRDPETGEYPVDPYVEDNANAGAEPFSGDRLAAAFGGREGIARMAERTVEISESDPRISGIFVAHDTVRLKRTLSEQFCYLLNAGCDYSGRDMKSAHDGMGLTTADLNALVENLQQAMREADVPFRAQNKLLSKLAPMSRDVVER
ncbi:hemoglobin [Altererythrobacter xiamenensis]|uniref:Hemoglobin n=1 Tax=Altererythrobacter xiamenensis TaxID=1316679 RepID=A0A1Y6EPV4_9SPHN|nr:group 1 truncated hemoglobin [Altererythrobacter xiamenensis]SMQ64366.1 hemoglobin [Altererythrobacter xiamenensis]